MSFGNRSYGERPIKRKKQDFHRHKIKPQETASFDLESQKQRTILSLGHLGEQRFSQEPGGYSFEHWMKSFNLLLDDFENSIGEDKLPKEYFAKRLELTSSLLASNETAELDLEVSKLEIEERELRTNIALLQAKNKKNKEIEERNQKLTLLEEEKKNALSQLDKANANLLARRKRIQDSSKLFRRIFGSVSSQLNEPNLESLEARVKSAQVKVEAIESKILEQRKKIDQSTLKSSPENVGDLDEAKAKLDLLLSNLQDLNQKRSEAKELVEKRKEITRQMADAISKLELHTQ
ncbi:MAG: coiled-coil domain-containing protein [Nitrososphaerales archaeon]